MSLGKNVRLLREARGLDQVALSKLSGVQVGTISALEVRASRRSDKAGALASALGVTIEQLTADELDPRLLAHGQTTATPRPAPIPIDLENNPDYPAIRRVLVKAQAGLTGYAVEDVQNGPPIVFRAEWYKSRGYRPDRLLALRVAGESMVPSLWPGDLIVINTEQTTPKDGVPFLVAYYGETTVKRLVMDAGQWWLASDNADQRRYPRKRCDDATTLIGAVVYKQSEQI